MSAALPIENLVALGEPAPVVACHHCGTQCGATRVHRESHAFCCTGCRTVFELLTENGLGQFYTLERTVGSPVSGPSRAERFQYLDDPTVRERMVDFSDGRITRVTLRLPAIHCVACVWLLENLFRLQPGIGSTVVQFARREATLTFEDARVRLSQIASLLESIGYEPDFKLSDLDRPSSRISRRLWLQLGVAGFTFGNTMLFSLPAYFGLDTGTGPLFRTVVGWIGLVLALPVVVFSAGDYWRNSWLSLKQRQLTLDVPIAAGIAALFLQSCWEVLSRTGEGYFDSLAGLLFFLLCGRVFQQKTFDRLTFDRDYRAFFPLSVARLAPSNGAEGGTTEERIALGKVVVGDRLVVRHGELIAADARLISGTAWIDYSFITGEAAAVRREPGALLYAGGRQMSGEVVIETEKPVSQSHLTSLWNQEAFRKAKDNTFNTVTNRYSRRFTWIILGIAVGAAAFWAWQNPAKALPAFTGVLIVACPCALALAAPFALGAGVRALGHRGIFLRNAEVIESLARVDSVVFDKTGTLTAAQQNGVRFEGAPLNQETRCAIRRLARQSTHPLATQIAAALHEDASAVEEGPGPDNFQEVAGKGITGTIRGRKIRLGSASFVAEALPEGNVPIHEAALGSTVHVLIDGRHLGVFVVGSRVRPDADQLLRKLSDTCDLALISGDNDRDREHFGRLFHDGATLRFNQSPLHKLEYVREQQAQGKTVMMVGDGLNDAGALRQSDVGVAVVEGVGSFSPASDIILEAAQVAATSSLLTYARQVVRIVRSGFLISTLYNAVGISIAASGNLSPVVCAILMPVSSVTVMVFTSGLAAWLGKRLPAAASTTSISPL